MQFIVDESTGAAVLEYLRSVGHDVLAVAETMPQAEDQDILARADHLRSSPALSRPSAASLWNADRKTSWISALPLLCSLAPLLPVSLSPPHLSAPAPLLPRSPGSV